MSVRVIRAALGLIVGTGVLAASGLAAVPVAAETGPARLAVIVPVTVPAQQGGLIEADALASYTAAGGLLRRQLDAIALHPVTLAIDPRIITSIRVLGSEAPPSALAWLQRLNSLPQESFALPYANADTTLATQAGAAAIPQAESLEFAIVPERFAPGGESAAPDAQATDSDPAMPDTSQLLSWNHRGVQPHWPVENSVIASDLALIAAAGFDTVLLSSGNTDATGPVAELGELRAIIADEHVSAALRDATGTGTMAGWTGALEVLGEHLAAGQSVVATLDRGPAGLGRLQQTLDALALDPDILLVPLSAIGAAAAPEAALIDLPQDPQRVAAVRPLIELDAQVQRFSAIGAEPEFIAGPRRLELLAALDAAWPGLDAVAQAAEASRDVLSAVQVVASTDVNFFTDRSSIQVPVRNDLDQAVTVYLTVSPDRPLLSVENRMVQLTLEPLSVVSAPVPVQSLSNGTVNLTMTLRSADGMAIGSPTRITVNVQAGWEGPIVGIIAAVLVLVFAGGLVRNILRRRRERADAA